MEQERLNVLLARVIRMAEEVNIPVSRSIRPQVAVNRRAKTRFGCCRRVAGEYQIEISAMVLEAQEDMVCRVLAHEVLHTCRGCANHGGRWQGYAKRMNDAYGLGIVRADSFDGLGLADDRPVRYWVECTSCGQRMGRMKRSSLVDHPERYRCRCGGTLRVEEN